MNDFEAELQALIDKHREFPGADLWDMMNVLWTATAALGKEAQLLGVFAEKTFE